MNHVFLSGELEGAAAWVSKENETPHITLTLAVTHRTASGAEKRERYPVSAWRGTALRLAELARAGARLSLKGYLSQRQTPQGMLVEVTAEEFTVAGGGQPGRAAPRFSPWNPDRAPQAARLPERMAPAGAIPPAGAPEPGRSATVPSEASVQSLGGAEPDWGETEAG